MIDHIGLRTARFETSKQFFIFSLAPLGIVPTLEYQGSISYSRDGAPTFGLGDSALAPSYMHVAFQTPSRAVVTDCIVKRSN
jgi:hypothetical protein